MTFHIVDDGSSDGTAQTLIREGITPISGSGSLYWAGGMRAAWQSYEARGAADVVLAVNDDCVFEVEVWSMVRECSQTGQVVVGLLHDGSGLIAYGGRNRTSRWHPLGLSLGNRGALVDTFNMNCVAFPHDVLERFGFLDARFQHGAADLELGFRLSKKGVEVRNSVSTVGVCRPNPLKGTSNEAGICFFERLRRRTGVKEQPVGQTLYYYRKVGGLLGFVFGPLWYCISIMRVHFSSASRCD